MREAAEEVHMLAAVATDVDKLETCSTAAESTDAVNVPVDMDFADVGTAIETRNSSSEISDGIVNTSVSVDRAKTQVFATQYPAAIYVDIGKVLDVEIMSRYCQACVTYAPLEERILKSFKFFKLNIVCGINSAPPMEAKGTACIFGSFTAIE